MDATSEPSAIIYSIRCPQCAAEATARMRVVDTLGTYQEPMLRYGVERIVCSACGLCQDIPPETTMDYELWFVTSYRNHRLWADSRKHLDFLIEWFSGAPPENELDWATQAVVQAFPKWMTVRRNHDGILRRLVQMRDRGVLWR